MYTCPGSSFPDSVDHFLHPITQVDGTDDLALLTPLYSPKLSLAPPGTALAPPQLNTRRAPFKLNQKKQLSSICKDTKINDFEITVSPIAHNVNIKCSTGFYTLVVLPSFSGLTQHYVNDVNGITVSCNSITGNIDDANSTVNAVIVFNLNYQDCPKGPIIGTVTMHLHHSVRKIQLQGSSLVHGKSRAPVWFVDNFVKGLFSFFSKSKSIDITKFNAAVHDMLTKHLHKIDSQEICSGCNSLFTGRSSPEFCFLCKLKYHKKCFHGTNHTCINHSQVYPSSNPFQSLTPGTVTNYAQLPDALTSSTLPTPSLVTATASRTMTGASSTTTTSSLVTSALTSVPLASSVPGPVYVTSAPQDQSHSLPQDLSSCEQPVGLNPLAPPFLDRQPPPQAAISDVGQLALTQAQSNPSQNSNSASRPRKRAKPFLGTDQQSLDLEYARIEVSTAMAKVRDQENTINDLEFRNKILEDRVEQLERNQKDEIYQKYFPSGTNKSANSMPIPGMSGCSHHHHTPLPLHCCFQQPCQHSCSSCPQSVNFPSGKQISPDSESAQILLNIAAIKKDLENLRRRFDSINSNPTPPPSTDPGSACPPQPPSSESNSAHCTQHTSSDSNIPLLAPPELSSADSPESEIIIQDEDNSFVSLDLELNEISSQVHLNCE